MRRRITADQFLGKPSMPLWVSALGMIAALCLIIGVGVLAAVVAAELMQ